MPVLNRLENVRYVQGAPSSLGHLSPGDQVSIAIETKDGPGPPAPNGRRPQVLSAVVIEASGHIERVPMEKISGMAIGSSEPPTEPDTLARLVEQPPGKMSTPWANINPLFMLPREPHRWLAIGLEETTMLFDVADRHWSDEDLVAKREPTLVRGADTHFVIEDRSFRWISVTELFMPPDGPTAAHERLSALIGHPAYWYGYISPRAVQLGIHGPYRLEEITPEAFQPLNATAAHRALNDWLLQYGPLPNDSNDADLDRVRRLIHEATSRFMLPDLGEAAQHEVGWILHSGFCELVLLGPGDAVTLIVASGD